MKKASIVAFVCLIAICAVSAEDERPSMILFIADDVSWNDYGCYGNAAARTPSIDRLAADGIRFDNAYLTASSCSPSRCSIATGRYPHNNGAAAELHRLLPWHLQKFPSALRDAGYYTVLSGKNHMVQEDPPAGEEGYAEPWELLTPGRAAGNSGGHADWVQILKNRPKDQPFFFWFASHDAHRQWDGDAEWNKGKYGPMHRLEDMIVPPFLVDNDETRQDLASYYNEVTRFDYHVGKVVEIMKEQGVLDNTLILVMADNGRPFPRAKTRVHDSGMKTALVAHWPMGIAKPGAVCKSVVSAIDLAPTFLEAAGVPIPESVQGVGLRPLFNDPSSQVRSAAFSEHNWHDYEAYGRSVRSEGFLYIINERPVLAWQGPADSVRSPSHQALRKKRDAGELDKAQSDVFLSPRPKEELYKIDTDPYQLSNLADDPAYADARERLSKLMQRWQEETGDSVPDDLSPDGFDRETGVRLGNFKPGTTPGEDRNASKINNPGPR